MLVRDHINGIGRRDLFSEAELVSAPPVTRGALGRRRPYAPEVLDLLREVALERGIRLREGILFAGKGPAYETAAEIAMARTMGADAACMSSAHEVDLAAAMGLATAFSQTLGMIFSRDPKPFEVEVLITELSPDGDHRLFRITYDGTLFDERRFVAIGGKAEQLTEALEDQWREDMTLQEAFAAGVEAFRRAEGRDSEGWEVAALDQTAGRRAFRRIDPGDLTG